MKKCLSIALCLATTLCLFSCENKFDSEYSDELVSFGIMKDWEQSDNETACWTKGDDFEIKYYSYVVSSSEANATSDELKNNICEFYENADKANFESKQIGDYDCLITKNLEYNNGEVQNFIEFRDNGFNCKFVFSDSAENDAINMVKSLKVKKLSEEEYSTLDSDWESSYLKFNISSNWNISYESDDDSHQSIYFEWLTNDYGCNIDFMFFSDDFYKKPTKYELEQDWYEHQEFLKNDETYDLYDESLKITDSFVKNSVPFIVISSDDPDTRKIEFVNDGIKGNITYSVNCEDIVMDLIDTIEYY